MHFSPVGLNTRYGGKFRLNQLEILLMRTRQELELTEILRMPIIVCTQSYGWPFKATPER